MADASSGGAGVRRLVIDLADARPIFALPPEVMDAIRSRLPGWEVVAVDVAADGTGDGGGPVSPRARDAVRSGAEIYMGFGIPAALIREGPGLRWVHSGSAGVRGSLTPELVASDVVFTNSAGIHGPPVAETVIAYLLHFARGLDLAVRAQARSVWDKRPFDGVDTPVRELGRSTVGVVGLGGIGREVAWRARSLGARVVATRRRPEAGGQEGVELLTGPDRLERLLERSDYVVLTLPETSETAGLIDAGALSRMRREAVLVNVSRGGLVDEPALVAALESGTIRGAALDTFTNEPLPEDHPLWSAPGVLITPHTSGYTRAFWEREAALILDNIDRYLRGAPLRNMVDRQAGY
ncbi:MAG: D-2-hydroxyacid dehydrogenase [Gemmatimonadota bacterium]